MNLSDIVSRKSPPDPWTEGDNIPWNDPVFSERMLREHLSQSHDAASRRSEAIGMHVGWVHRQILEETPSRILDIGCGPGLYLLRLASLGHQCAGVDFSPASIKYAKEQAQAEGATIEYIHEDIREADFGTGFDLVMQIYGEVNVFPRDGLRTILRKAHGALKPGGALVIEPHTYSAIENIGKEPPSWHSAEGGLFSDEPYVCLKENFWDSDSRIATTRYFVVNVKTCEVSRYAASYQAYTDSEYEALLAECGFSGISLYESLPGNPKEQQKDLFVIAAKKLD